MNKYKNKSSIVIVAVGLAIWGMQSHVHTLAWAYFRLQRKHQTCSKRTLFLELIFKIDDNLQFYWQLKFYNFSFTIIDYGESLIMVEGEIKRTFFIFSRNLQKYYCQSVKSTKRIKKKSVKVYPSWLCHEEKFDF